MTKIAFCSALLLSSTAMANDATSKIDYDQQIMDRVTVVGSAENVADITGSATYLSEEAIKTHNYTDVNRVMQQIPGVNIQEEEGFGNRPNIGLRGGRSERSANITLMEDGVLIAPAPYAAPAAYYFPRINRMEAVEVRKGSSTVKFGPRTTSGAVNLVSSSVPREEEFEATLGLGSNNAQLGELHYGNSIDNFGFVFDFSHDANDGFKNIDGVGGDSGYSIQDVMGKFRVETDTGADIYQSLELKLGATWEDSDETYLGLTNADFRADPYRRYAASQEDNMNADHQQIQLRHYVDFDKFDLTTTLYHNAFKRNWYKLQSVTQGGEKLNLSPALESASHLAALKGELDLDGSADNRLTVRANNREYFSQGIQTNATTEFDTGEFGHFVEVGARYHRDEEDRFQQEDDYSIIGGETALTSLGAAGSHANREADAEAVALYVSDEITVGDLTVSPGLRYETIRLKRDDYNSGQSRENHVDALVPGLGLGYQISDSLSAFGGVHKGFAPPAPGSTGQEEEESVNYELGLRYNSENTGLNAEVAGFYNDYSNLLGTCTNSSGCANGAGDQFNAGEVEVLGVEASLGYDAAPLFGLKGMSVPLLANYTYTQAEFQNSFSSAFSEWGNVTAGDELPYIPEHQFFVSAGLEADMWSVNLAGKFNDAMRTQAGSGKIPNGEGTDANFVVDASAEVEVFENARGFLNVYNITDQEYISARRPAGARPGAPRTFLAGMRYAF